MLARGPSCSIKLVAPSRLGELEQLVDLVGHRLFASNENRQQRTATGAHTLFSLMRVDFLQPQTDTVRIRTQERGAKTASFGTSCREEPLWRIAAWHSAPEQVMR